MIKKKHSDSQGKSIPYMFSAVVAAAGEPSVKPDGCFAICIVEQESDRDSMIETGISCVAVLMLIVTVYRCLFKTTGLNRCKEVG